MTALPAEDGVKVTGLEQVDVVALRAVRLQVLLLNLPEAVLVLARVKVTMPVGVVGLVEVLLT